MKHNLVTSTLLIIFGALVLVLTGCQMGGPPDFPAVARLTTVGQETWRITYATSGTVEANNKVDINVETAGTVVAIHFNEGQFVSKGQTLIRLRADKFAAQVQNAKDEVNVQSAEITRLQSMVRAAESRKKLAQSELQKFQNLYEQELISSLELDQKRNVYDTAVADYNAAVSQLTASNARKTQAQSNYRYNQAIASETVIRAPFSGRVGQKYVDLGDYVINTEKIVTIVDDSLLKVDFTVPERYLSNIRSGMPVLVYTEGQEEKPYHATVNFVDPVVNPDSRTILVKATIQDADQYIKHGQSVKAQLVLRTIDRAVVIPEESITRQGEKSFVYKVVDGLASLTEVTIGSREAGKAQITSGVSPGDRIVRTGLQKVYDGAKIQEVKDDVPAKNPNKKPTATETEEQPPKKAASEKTNQDS